MRDLLILLWPVSVAVGLAGEVRAIPQGRTIATTKHNLSASGPGPYKAGGESRICIFCHAPHNSRTQVPLWNRKDSTASYLPYKSSTLLGSVAQPNGSTKLCLSCHDGTVALGSLVSLTSEVPMATGRRLLSEGPSFLGVNLRDDHPVSFPYESSRGGSGVDYLAASAILDPVTLDGTGQVQCTSCHDVHSNLHGAFLRRSNKHGQLCLSCHNPRDWNVGAHSLSTAVWNKSGLDPWPKSPYATVAENACANCHNTHSAKSPERLLKFVIEEENCLRCHNGNVARLDIGADLGKAWRHPTTTTQGTHDAAENPLTMARHAECQDCHNPHAARAGGVAAPGVSGPLLGVSGINNSGQLVPRIQFGYQLCYKCHADNPGGTIYVPRRIPQPNIRKKFAITNPSFHPIETSGRNSDVPSLLAPWNVGSIMSCTDCHASDSSPAFGGSGPSGPHGSIYKPLLGARYDFTDNRDETSATYALCYKCHSRSSILSDVTFKEHRKHIVKEKAACSTCHDPHGVENSADPLGSGAKLINFDISVVQPSVKNPGVLRYQNLGIRQGSCTLRCHGKDHDAKKY